MRIPDLFRKSVTYLYVDEKEPNGKTTRKPVATAFYVGFDNQPTSPLYVISAGHVVEQARPYGSLFIRLNRPNGTYEDVPTSPDDWVILPGSDVAAKSLADLPEEYDIAVIPVKMLATRDFVRGSDIGPGDDVFFIGLFSQRPGSSRPEPIVRFGNVALIPQDKVKIRIAGDTEITVEAYLVEARSWGGHSGSPVFVYFAPDRNPGILMAGGGADPRLLGLVQGHYELEGRLKGDVVGTESVRLNAAIVVVIPAAEILELLELPKFADERAKLLVRTDSPVQD